MILVTLGTQDKPFKRLILSVEKQIREGRIKEKVIVQNGTTKYETNLPKEKMELIDFIPEGEFNKYIEEASLIITHAGVGSIIESLNKNKKVIAVARLKRYREHVNDHQKQIVENFADKGYIIPLDNVDDLDKALDEVEKFEPKKYKGNNKNFLKKLENELEDALN